MKTSSPQRIKDYTEREWWGQETLHSLLGTQAKVNPDLIAVADQPNREELTGDLPYRLSFQDLDFSSTTLACQLLDNQIKSGDTIIVQLPNIVELVVCYMACSKIGAIISPVPVQYGRHELLHIHKMISSKAIITIERFKEQTLARGAAECLEDSIKILVFGTNIEIDANYDDGYRKQLQKFQDIHSSDANTILTICWTSGTTGTPKGVPRSHNMWIATARCCIEASEPRQGDRFLNIFPLVNMASIGAFLYPSLLVGCSIFLHHPLDPGLYLTQLQNEKITFTVAPPVLLNQLAKSEDMWKRFDFSNLRSVGSGSAPLAPWMIETFSRVYGLEVINFYGSNEGISLFCTPVHTQDPVVRATMFPRVGCGLHNGTSYASTSVLSKIVDPDTGEEIRESGSVGELLFDGATVFDGYLGMDNCDVFDSDGYFHTGDLVEICGDPPLFYKIAGRCKDIINRGGMKISPAEVDILLEGLPSTLEAAICAYPDDDLGEKLCACIVMESGVPNISLEDVNGYLNSKGIAKFKLPERIAFFDALPRNPLAKVQRFELEEWVRQLLSGNH
jgi:acyl-CoA synthetase (AMP-forming)/AMP-acid ligase II